VGNTPSECADSLHLLGLEQLGFKALPFRHVTDNGAKKGAIAGLPTGE
jgi:hypothetical protein